MKNIILIIAIAGLFLLSCTETEQISSKPDIPDSLEFVVPKHIFSGTRFAFVYNDKLITTKVLDIECFEPGNQVLLQEQAARAGISSDSALVLAIKAKKLADSLILEKEVRITRNSSGSDYDSWGRIYRYVEVAGLRYDSIMLERNLVLLLK
ncbi:MAG: hypothetical protein GX121_07680 [Ignavibacteria bacterium]|nr:hypothetical protein [Ignavibacteria bacterium]